MFFRFFALVMSTLLISSSSWALMTVQESAEITPLGNYKVGLEPQFITSSRSGMNISGFFDAPINEESSFRVQVGTGDTDFYGGGSFKWTPFPDFKNQPALAGKVSAIYGRQDNLSLFIFRLEPIVSKKFESSLGLFIPYGSLPLNHTTLDGHSETEIQLAGGTEFISNQLENVTFGAELGLNARNAFSYVSGFATIYLDEAKARGQ